IASPSLLNRLRRPDQGLAWDVRGPGGRGRARLTTSCLARHRVLARHASHADVVRDRPGRAPGSGQRQPDRRTVPAAPRRGHRAAGVVTGASFRRATALPLPGEPMSAPIPRPGDDTLRGFLHGTLPREEADRVRAWLEADPAAADSLRRLAAADP